MLAGYQDSIVQSIPGILIPNAGVYVNWDIQNLSVTIEQIAEDTDKSIMPQETSLDSLAWIAFDNSVSLDFLQVKTRRGMYSGHTMCCPYISTSVEV